MGCCWSVCLLPAESREKHPTGQAEAIPGQLPANGQLSTLAPAVGMALPQLHSAAVPAPATVRPGWPPPDGAVSVLGLGTGLGGSEGTGGAGPGCGLRREGLLLDRVFVLMKVELSVLYLVISLSVSYIRRLCLTQGREDLFLGFLLQVL